MIRCWTRMGSSCFQIFQIQNQKFNEVMSGDRVGLSANQNQSDDLLLYSFAKKFAYLPMCGDALS